MVLRRFSRVAVGMLVMTSNALAQTPAEPPPTAPPRAGAAPPAAPPPPPPLPAPLPAPPAAEPAPPDTTVPAPVGAAPNAPVTSTPPPPPLAVEPPRPVIDVRPPPAPPDHEHPREPARLPRPWFGGLGYGSVAPFFGSLGGLESMLGSPAGLGQSYGAPNTGLLFGGGGGVLLFGHLWIGGKGYGLVTGGFENALGEVSISGGGGGAELGYALAPSPRVLVIPFLGVGGFGRSIDVENQSNVDLIDTTRSLEADSDGRRIIAPPGGSRSFGASFATLEAGIRIHRLLFNRSSGFTAGFELGFMSSFTEPAWETDGYEVTNAEGASLEGVYIRLNLGTGGFVFR